MEERTEKFIKEDGKVYQIITLKREITREDIINNETALSKVASDLQREYDTVATVKVMLDAK